MDFFEIYHFLFETTTGVACMIGICLVLSVIACVIMERRTRKRYVDRKNEDDDDWSLFDDDEDNKETSKSKASSKKSK